MTWVDIDTSTRRDPEAMRIEWRLVRHPDHWDAVALLEAAAEDVWSHAVVLRSGRSPVLLLSS